MSLDMNLCDSTAPSHKSSIADRWDEYLTLFYSLINNILTTGLIDSGDFDFFCMILLLMVLLLKYFFMYLCNKIRVIYLYHNINYLDLKNSNVYIPQQLSKCILLPVIIKQTLALSSI